MRIRKLKRFESLTFKEAKRRFPDLKEGQTWRGAKEKYLFVCEIHGTYKQRYNLHAQGTRCMRCAIDKKKLTMGKVEKRFPDTIKGQIWTGVNSLYRFNCKYHGPYQQRYIIHAAGSKCGKCRRVHLTFTIKKAEKRCSDMIRGQYWRGVEHPYLFKCKLHGIYQQAFSRHLKGAGCHRCAQISGGEKIKKYHVDPQREGSIKLKYGLVLKDMKFMYKLQKRKCIWCSKKLPSDVLRCAVDHIGGYETHGNRKKVRGLCCPSGQCNRDAGRIENNIRFSKRVLKILATNKGNLNFPR